MYHFDKIIVVTKRTALQELSEQFGTRSQAKFYIEQSAMHSANAKGMAGTSAPSFASYERTDATYQEAVRRLKAVLPGTVRTQFLDSVYLPTYTFSPTDLIIVIGPDGLVVNTAKYLENQPIIAVNPDPLSIEGVLLPFRPETVPATLTALTTGSVNMRPLTMAEARLDNGQTLLAVNDLFIGQRTHVSARYRIGFNQRQENQSSSGIIVSTGTGSTGWLRSVITGAVQIQASLTPQKDSAPATNLAVSDGLYRFNPSSEALRFVVREPWVSKTTQASIVYGEIVAGQTLEIISQMPQNGCIFSDGIEADYLPFNSGSTARIRVAARRVSLIIPSTDSTNAVSRSATLHGKSERTYHRE